MFFLKRLWCFSSFFLGGGRKNPCHAPKIKYQQHEKSYLNMVWLFVLSGMRSAEDEQTQEPGK
jgi:hypothetical protein